MLPEEKLTDKQIEMARNKQEFSRCNMIYTITAIPNLGAMALMIGSSLFNAFHSLLAARPENFVSYLIVGLLLCPASCAMAILCGYLKKDMMGIYALIPAAAAFLLNAVLEADDSADPFLAVIVVLITIVPIVYANHRYRYLETQEGFPYFSELLNEQQKKSEELKHTDPYEEAAKRRKLTESRDMSGLELSGERIVPKKNGNTDYMESI